MRGGVPLPGTRCRPQPARHAVVSGSMLRDVPSPAFPALAASRCAGAFCRGAPSARGGYGLRGGRLRRQEEQAPRKEPCRPPYDMSHSLQSRYFDRTSYEFLRECKALIRKNTPQVFCFVVSAFRFRRFWFLRPVVPALLNLLFRAFRPVVPPCKSLFFWIFPELYLPLPEINIRSDENERLMRSVPLN